MKVRDRHWTEIQNKQIVSLEINEAEIMGKYRGSLWCSRRSNLRFSKQLKQNPLSLQHRHLSFSENEIKAISL